MQMPQCKCKNVNQLRNVNVGAFLSRKILSLCLPACFSQHYGPVLTSPTWPSSYPIMCHHGNQLRLVVVVSPRNPVPCPCSQPALFSVLNVGLMVRLVGWCLIPSLPFKGRLRCAPGRQVSSFFIITASVCLGLCAVPI